MTQRSVQIGRWLLILSILAVLLGPGPALAQDDEDTGAESTIRLMGAAEAELPDAVTKEIKLPPAAAENAAAVEKAKKGADQANEARERREQGQSRAEEARERGAEMAEEARQNRENRGRFEDRPAPPNRPDRPQGPPNNR